MDLCGHINGYSLAIKYFPNCFDRNLQLKNSTKLENVLDKRINLLRKKGRINYEEIFSARTYILGTLGTAKRTFDNIRDIDIKVLYLKYEDILTWGDKKGDGYNYLFLLSVLKKPILEVLRSMDTKISCFPNDEGTKEIKDFISKWNHLFNSDYIDYNYITLDIFINELNELSKGNPILMGYNNIFDEALIQLDNNPHILRKKK